MSQRKTLPAKHNQLVVYSYWMLNQMKSDGKITNESFHECLDKFHVFDAIEVQKEYLDHYLEDFKLIHKNLKKEVREKTKKQKEKQKKEKKETDQPKKRGRKRKVIVDNRSPEEILLDEIIRNCYKEQNQDPEPEPEPDTKPRYRRRMKTISYVVPDDNIISQCDAVSNDCKDNEDRKCIEEEEEEEEEKEIEVRKIIIHHVTYLIDDDNNVYDVETHEALGVYDKNTLQIVRD